MLRGAQIASLCIFMFEYAVPSSAAHLQLDKTAVEKLMTTHLFREDGKWHLAKPDKCNDPYLEYPSANLVRGRLILKARFAGRVGADVLGACISAGEPSWITVSAKPVISGHMLSLDDIRVDSVEKPAVRAIASTLLQEALRSARFDVDHAIAELITPERTAPYLVQFENLSLRLIEVDRDYLLISVDFDLRIK